MGTRNTAKLGYGLIIISLIGFGLNFTSSPAAASSISVLHGKIDDPQGNPISGIGVVIHSTNGGQTLEVRTKSDKDGNFKGQSYPNFNIEMSSSDNSHCIGSGFYVSGIVPSNGKVVEVTIPSEKFITVTATNTLGVPMPGIQITEFRYDLPNGLKGGSGCGGNTDSDGKINLEIFDGAQGESGNPDFFYAAYMPFENVSVIRRVPFSEILSNQVTVVFDDVPAITIEAPATQSSTKSFSVTATVLDSSGTVASEMPLQQTRMSSTATRMQYRQVDLYKRTKSKGKWGSWTRVKRISVGNSGIAVFSKLKWKKGTYQIQTRGFEFSAGSRSQTIIVR